MSSAQNEQILKPKTKKDKSGTRLASEREREREREEHIYKELALDQSSRHSFTQARKRSTTSASSSVNNTKIFFAKLFEFFVSRADEPLEINQIESEKVRTEGQRTRGEKKDEEDDGDDHERKQQHTSSVQNSWELRAPLPLLPKKPPMAVPPTPIDLFFCLFGLRAASHTTSEDD